MTYGYRRGAGSAGQTKKEGGRKTPQRNLQPSFLPAQTFIAYRLQESQHSLRHFAVSTSLSLSTYIFILPTMAQKFDPETAENFEDVSYKSRSPYKILQLTILIPVFIVTDGEAVRRQRSDTILSHFPRKLRIPSLTSTYSRRTPHDILVHPRKSTRLQTSPHKDGRRDCRTF